MKINRRKQILEKYALQQIEEFDLTDEEIKIVGDLLNQIVLKAVTDAVKEQEMLIYKEIDGLADKLISDAKSIDMQEKNIIIPSEIVEEEFMLPKAASKKEE